MRLQFTFFFCTLMKKKQHISSQLLLASYHWPENNIKDAIRVEFFNMTTIPGFQTKETQYKRKCNFMFTKDLKELQLIFGPWYAITNQYFLLSAESCKVTGKTLREYKRISDNLLSTFYTVYQKGAIEPSKLMFNQRFMRPLQGVLDTWQLTVLYIRWCH